MINIIKLLFIFFLEVSFTQCEEINFTKFNSYINKNVEHIRHELNRNSKIVLVPSHDPETYDEYLFLDEDGEIRMFLQKGRIKSIEISDDKKVKGIEYQIGDEFCKIISSNKKLNFNYDFTDGARARLIDQDRNISYWFHAENYLYDLYLNGAINKSNPGLCGMTIKSIQIGIN